METIKKIINNIPVTYIKTDKFKSVCGALYFKTLVTKENITIRNLLSKVMIKSCKKFDTNEKLNINTLENYNAYYGSSIRRVGNYLINSFCFECINDKFIKDDVIKPVIDTFCELIYNPNVIDDAFEKKNYDLSFQKLKISLQNEKENPRNYCYKNLLDKMGEDLSYSIHSNLDSLNNITPEKLYKEYLDMINNSEVELVLAGDFDFEAVSSEVLKNLKTKEFSEEKFVINNHFNNPFKVYEESIKTNASVLFLGMKCFDLTKYERSYVMPIYSMILGGGSSSRCFNSVREENSLAYYCYSKYEKDDSIISVYAGIDKDNFSKAKDIIINTIKSMSDINDEEIKRAKKEITSSLKEKEDYLMSLLGLSYYQTFYCEDLDDRIDMFNKVTKEEILNLNDKIKMDSLYFLKGDK